MGLQPLMMGAAAAIAGKGNPTGTLLVAFLMGILQHSSAAIISTSWIETVGFVVMLIFVYGRSRMPE